MKRITLPVLILGILSLTNLASSLKGVKFLRKNDDSVKINWNVYHTTEVFTNFLKFNQNIKEMNKEINDLIDDCDGMLSKTTILEDPQIEMLKISNEKEIGVKHDSFLLFGEHARELISSETGLNIVKAMCGKVETTVDVQKTLKNYNFHVVLNANPLSRLEVEKGNYCQRVDENGVDLNRNWNSHWEFDGKKDDDTFTGYTAFSEKEDVALKKALE
jgi:hypothetical protein